MLARRQTLAVLAGAALAAGPAARRAAAQPVVSTSSGPLRLTRVVEGLEHPWALTFLQDGTMLVTERAGRLRLVSEGTAPRTVEGVPQVWARGQGGLLDVALHPNHGSNRWVYLAYSGPSSGGHSTHVLRARLDGARLVDGRVIYVAEPGSGTTRHFGCRMVFDRAGFLYVGVGDRGEMARAQRLDDLAGTVARLHDDGRVPADNPFVGRSGARPEIWAYGVRNPQGMALHPTTGELWEQEHGPRGGDEVNIIRAGRNYGWPLVTHGIDYSGLPIGTGKEAPGVEPPIWTWVPSIAPSGMAFYTGDAIPAWRGSLLIGALKDELLVRLTLDGDRVTAEERLLQGAIGRIRDVRVGPDGHVYLVNDERTAGVFRLAPVAG
jgi:glucose/arabinose dehydrogenase